MENLNSLTHKQIVNMSNDPSLDPETKQQVDTYLNETKSKTENLEFLHRLGLKFDKNINGQVLTRSKSGNRIDFLAVFLGFLSIPILGLALGKLIHGVFYGKLTGTDFIILAFLFLLGGLLFALLLKGWNRRFMFAGFALEKNNSNFKLRQMSNFTTSETNFSLDSKLSVKHIGEKVSVVLTENSQEHTLFTLPKLSSLQLDSLNALVAKFN